MRMHILCVYVYACVYTYVCVCVLLRQVKFEDAAFSEMLLVGMLVMYFGSLESLSSPFYTLKPQRAFVSLVY